MTIIKRTGLRLGWVAGPKKVMKCIQNIHGNASVCVNLPLQVGLAKFLRYSPFLFLLKINTISEPHSPRHDADFAARNKIRRKLQKRRDLFMKLFHSLPALKKCTNKNVPTGAFYYFPDIRCYLNTKVKKTNITEGQEADKDEYIHIKTDSDLAMYLLSEAKVVTIPGSSFLREGHFRLAFSRYG